LLKAACILLLAVMVAGGIGIGVVDDLPPPDYHLVPGSANVLPSFGAKPDAFAVEISPETSQGMMLALVSLQGLVNREGAQIFLNTSGTDNTSFLLPLIQGKYHVNFTAISVAEFLHNFSSFATGLIVYDPARPETTTVATVMAGLEDCIMVEPSLEVEISAQAGLSVKYDLRQPPWSGLTNLQMQRKSFDEFYPRSAKNVLGTIEPEKTGLRDYLIGAKVWTFHARQGPFASQEEIDFTKDILAATPHNIPVLGWFETPNLVEENFFVQAASREGKYILGGHNVPNLSFLSALSPPEPFDQKRVIPPTPTLADDGIYVSFAVPDGDNIDFSASKMLEVWHDEVRGTMPIAWSIGPLLAQLAPPLLDYYYSEATTLDSFIAGPSGAGYLYPGFAPQGDLEQFLVSTKHAMAAADLDMVWLLNAFRAYEVPYREETLMAYVDTLEPRGIVLDYSDQAVTRDIWMQGGETSGAPIIRSTHLWSGQDNLVGKVMADVDAAPSKPHFFFVVVYPWTLRLGEAVRSLETLRARYGDRVTVVSVENMLGLVTASFVREAARTIDEARSNPFSALDPWDMDSATELIERASLGDPDHVTSYSGLLAFDALGHAQRAVAIGTTTAILMLILIFIVTIIIWRFRHSGESLRTKRAYDSLLPIAASIFLFYLFFAGLQRALDYNFWTYASVFVAGVALLLAPRLQGWLGTLLGGYIWIAELGILALSGLFLLREPWAFVPFACTNAMLLTRFLGSKGMTRGMDMGWLGFGAIAGTLIRLEAASLVLSVTVLVGVGYVLNPGNSVVETGKTRGHPRGVAFAATVAALPVIWIALFQNRYFFEKAGGGLLFPVELAYVVLLGAPLIALILWATFDRARKVDSLILLTATSVLWIVLWFSQGAMAFAIIVMAIAVVLCWSYLSAASRVKWDTGVLARFVPRLLILSTIVVVLIRMPAIVYSLYMIKFPLPVEYILYTPAILMIFATLDIVQTEALVRAARRKPKREPDTNQEKG